MKSIDFWNGGKGTILYTIDVEDDGHKYVHIHGVTESDTSWWETSLCTCCMQEIDEDWCNLSRSEKIDILNDIIDMRTKYCMRWENKLDADKWMNDFVGNWIINEGESELNTRPIYHNILKADSNLTEGYYICKLNLY